MNGILGEALCIKRLKFRSLFTQVLQSYCTKKRPQVSSRPVEIPKSWKIFNTDCGIWANSARVSLMFIPWEQSDSLFCCCFRSLPRQQGRPGVNVIHLFVFHHQRRCDQISWSVCAWQNFMVTVVLAGKAATYPNEHLVVLHSMDQLLAIQKI